MKKAIQFGAGNIGRGFIGGLLSEAGYHVVFADVNQEIVDKINEDKKYTIYVKDVESKEIVITDISAVNSTKPELIDEIKLERKMPLLIEIPDRHGTGRKKDFITSYVNEAIGLKL